MRFVFDNPILVLYNFLINYGGICMRKRPIVIMVAMKIEAAWLIDKLVNVKCETVNQYTFYEGFINDYPVVICHSLVGTINAAVATYIAIEKYQPIAIISEGTAGSHGKDIHKGDIVVGEKCVNIMSVKTPHKKKGEGSNSLNWEFVNFISGEDNRLVYQYGDKHLIELAQKVDYTNGKIYFGTIGSGDVWNNETDKILWLNKNLGTLCEEMEGIAVYTVANNFAVPVLGIRIISNNEILGELYDRNIDLKSQEFTYELILQFIAGIF